MNYLSIVIVISLNVILSSCSSDLYENKLNENLPGWPECDAEIVTWHPHPLTCTRYLLCFHGNPIERLCAPGLHFSPNWLQCMFPQLAHCDLNYACPAVDDELNPVFLPDATDCSRYYVCFKGSPISRGCAENLWFDVVYNWCTIADEVNCDSRVPNNPRPPTTTEIPPTTPLETTLLPTTPPVTTPPPTQPPTIPPTIPPTTPPTTSAPTTTPNPNTMDCPTGSEPSFHPHSRDCQLYFICINGVAFLRQCATNLIFDIIRRECGEKETSMCISGTFKGPPRDMSGTEFLCPSHLGADEMAIYPHQAKCERYYVCLNGIAFLNTCPSGQIYDIATEQCKNKQEGVCLKDL